MMFLGSYRSWLESRAYPCRPHSVCLALLCLVVFLTNSHAQKTAGSNNTFLEPADSLDKARLYGLLGATGALYTGAMIGLNQLWYKDYPRSGFHFFNDGKEWQQVDKFGHSHTAYFESVWAMEALMWAGVHEKKAAVYGGVVGFFLQSSIEVLDGFSEEWGASAPDLLANGMGSALATGQQLAWGEQRMVLKFSTHAYKYPEGQLSRRADALYGSRALQRLLKDYNTQVYWMSINPASFFKRKGRLQWINLALGYGAGGMYGGFENRWQNEEGMNLDYSSIERYRQFFVSVDVDLTRIPVRSRGAKAVLYILNVFKMPAPALEFNTMGEVIFHPVYFLNWDLPIYFKR